MGYMGFGMRKEVYTRKPKKAFEKIKEKYRENPKFPDSKEKGVDKPVGRFIRFNYKDFTQTFFYSILKWAFILIFIGGIFWFAVLKEEYYNYHRNVFEKQNFPSFYQSQLSAFDDIVSFTSGRVDKIVSVGFDSRFQSFNLTIKDAQISPSTRIKDIHHIGFDGITNDKYQINNDEIVYNSLTIDRKDFMLKTYQNYWIYHLQDVQMEQIPVSVIAYLDTNPEKFADFMQQVKSFGRQVEINDNSVSFSFHKEHYGHYKILYSSKPIKTNYDPEGNNQELPLIGKLGDNLYWVRKYDEVYN